MSLVWRVAVPSPLRRLFHYLPPKQGATGNPVGCRVRVPFGSRQQVGVVTATGEHDGSVPFDKLRPVTELLDAEPLIPADMVALGRWAADYYHHPPGEVFEQLLPAALRRPVPASAGKRREWQLSESGKRQDPEKLRRAPRQRAMLTLLQQAGAAVGADELAVLGEGWRDVARRLEDKGLVVRRERMAAPPMSHGQGTGVALNPDQAAAVEEITRDENRFRCHLLEGVTGSGKTEVYLACIRRALEHGRQVLVLVPEIALTPQLTRRFREGLQARVALYHSGMGDGERRDTWLLAREGKLDVIIGTRSAIFLPLARPGLFILDEEHDSAYKQQEGWRYSARDLAVVRAREQAVNVVLGSATPSLESLRNAESGRYHRIRLPSRAGAARPPRLRLVDIRGEHLDAGLSGELLRAMDRHLAAGNQALLFLNRRGYAPVLVCHDCGWHAECLRCDARMTYHRGRNSLDCHHCGASRGVPRACPECAGGRLTLPGQGTERLEQALARRYPDYGISRIDRDTTRRAGTLESLLETARSGEARILVGTQMLAKGHDFPDLTLVGLIDADQGLMSADFRGPERTAQLITQVAGRAGRGEQVGEVLIQTRNPEHELLLHLIRDGYAKFARAALVEREQAALPPYSHLALLRAEAHRRDAVRDFLGEALDLGRQYGEDSGVGSAVLLMGPVPAPMERRAGRLRWQLMLQADARGPLHRLLAQWAPALETLKTARRVRWSLDVDPIELF